MAISFLTCHTGKLYQWTSSVSVNCYHLFIPFMPNEWINSLLYFLTLQKINTDGDRKNHFSVSNKSSFSHSTNVWQTLFRCNLSHPICLVVFHIMSLFSRVPLHKSTSLCFLVVMIVMVVMMLVHVMMFVFLDDDVLGAARRPRRRRMFPLYPLSNLLHRQLPVLLPVSMATVVMWRHGFRDVCRETDWSHFVTLRRGRRLGLKWWGRKRLLWRTQGRTHSVSLRLRQSQRHLLARNCNVMFHLCFHILFELGV